MIQGEPEFYDISSASDHIPEILVASVYLQPEGGVIVLGADTNGDNILSYVGGDLNKACSALCGTVLDNLRQCDIDKLQEHRLSQESKDSGLEHFEKLVNT